MGQMAKRDPHVGQVDVPWVNRAFPGPSEHPLGQERVPLRQASVPLGQSDPTSGPLCCSRQLHHRFRQAVPRGGQRALTLSGHAPARGHRLALPLRNSEFPEGPYCTVRRVLFRHRRRRMKSFVGSAASCPCLVCAYIYVSMWSGRWGSLGLGVGKIDIASSKR